MNARRPLLIGLAAALALHALVLDQVQEALEPIDLGLPAMQRIDTPFTQLLQPSAPVGVVAAPTAPRRRAPVAPVAAERAAPPTEAASAPEPAASNSLAAADASASMPSPAAAGESDATSVATSVATPASDPEAMAAAAPNPGASAADSAPPGAAARAALAPAGSASASTGTSTAAATSFSWPRSTRLRYQLRGWFRGEVLGDATVEWLRQGERYQVHLTVSIGPSFAPLVTRRMSSEGRIADTGLVPQRYEQETQQIIGRTRRQQMRFEADSIELERGQRVPAPPLVQDTASQFIQIIYLLRTRAELAEPGRAIEFPLALPNRIDPWVYEVAGRERTDTPFGAIDTLHVRPRRRAEGNNLTAQMWYAPTLQMLPVRIRIDQDAETWADLRLERAPEQAAP